MFGERVLGKVAAAQAAVDANNGAGGGAMQFGERVLGNKFRRRSPLLMVPAEPAPAPRVVPAKPPVPQPPRPKAVLGTTTKNRVPVAARAKAAIPPVNPLGQPKALAASFTELEVETMLAEDPNLWSRVLDAEHARPDGPRPAVARLVLNVVDVATEPAVPTKIVAELAAIAAAKPVEV